MKKIILSCREKAFKVSANSIYGFLGMGKNGGAKLPALEIANAITSCGRRMIRQVNDYLTANYDVKIIYGDTDSTMITIAGVDDMKSCLEYGNRIMNEINKLFPDPIKIELEKIIHQLTLKKKRYAYLTINPKTGECERGDDGKLKITIKGGLSARRDNCKWSRDVYNSLLEMVMSKKDFLTTLTSLTSDISCLIRGEIDIKDLYIIKSVKGSYKQKGYCMKVFVDRLLEMGKPIQPGERISYLVVTVDDDPHINSKAKLGLKMVLPETYHDSQKTDTPLKLDIAYYIRKILGSNIDQVLYAGYKDQIDSLDDFEYRRTPRCKLTSKLDNYSEIIALTYEADLDVNEIPPIVRNYLETERTIVYLRD